MHNQKNKLIQTYKKITLFFITISIGLFFKSVAIGQTCPGSQPANTDCVAYGNYKTITAFSVTRTITNNHASGKAIMIPLGTAAQWTQMYSNPPAGVTASSPSYRLTFTGRCDYTAACWYYAGAGGWEGMRCSQPVDVGKIGTQAGCQTTQNIYTVSGNQAATLYTSSFGYTSGNGGCEYRCDYY